MSTNKKFRIQNGVDIHGGGLSIDDVTVIDADGKVVAAAIADAVAGLTSSDIADLQAQVSAILGTSPETLDTLQEIVAAFEAADTTLTGTIAQNAADIATINTTLTNGVATPTDVADLQSQVTSNDADIAANAAAIAAANSRTSGISTSSGSSNIQMTAEVDMDSNKVTNMADPTAAQDAATKAYVDAASSTSSTDLATETAARIAGDAASVSTAAADATTKADQAEADAKAYADAQIAVETSARTSADTTLQSNIDTVSGRVDAILNGAGESLDTVVELVAAFEGADSDLQAVMTANSSAISTLDAFVGEGNTEAPNELSASLISGFENVNLATFDPVGTHGFRAVLAGSQNNNDQYTWHNGSASAKLLIDGDLLTSGVQYDIAFTVTGVNVTGGFEREAHMKLYAYGGQYNQNRVGVAGLRVQGDYDDPYTSTNDFTHQFNVGSGGYYWLELHFNGQAGDEWLIEDIKIYEKNAVVVPLDTTAQTVAGAINEVHSGLDAEVARATAAEGVLTTDLAAEVARATAAEGVLQGNIDAEEAARIAGDASVSSDVATLESTVLGSTATNLPETWVQPANSSQDWSIQVVAGQQFTITADVNNGSSIGINLLDENGVYVTGVSQDNTISFTHTPSSSGVYTIRFNTSTHYAATFSNVSSTGLASVGSLDTTASSVFGAINELVASDASLSSAISAEETARIAADAALASDIVSSTTLVAGDGISVDNLTHTVALDGSAISQNLVPSADNTYTLGSPDKVWKDVYIGPGSLYIGGQKVIEDNSGTITVNADPNQNLTVQTTGTGALNVQSTGSGGVSIDAASESVSIKSNLVMSVDKTISTAGGAATKMGGDVDMQGHSVTGLGAPSAAADAATKSYVDGRIAEGTISGGKTFSDDVIISGNLTVSGTTTTVNSETISLADNIIDLNSNLTSGAPSENAGIRVMRGDESAVQVRWNETSDHWETYNGSAWTKIALSTSDLAEGSNLYFTEQRAKDCLTGGLCITYNSTTGEIAVDETEAESSLRVAESVASDDADKLDGQEGTYYRINVYNVAGTLVN